MTDYKATLPRLRIIAWPARSNAKANPYNLLLTNSLEQFEELEVVEFSPRNLLLGRYDIWHMHWPDSILFGRSVVEAAFRVAILVFLVWLSKLRGTVLFLTLHNLKLHENSHPRLQKLLSRFLDLNVDAFIALSNQSVRKALEVYRSVERKPTFIVPHGLYEGVYDKSMPRGVARELLEIPDDAFVYLFIGTIRKYKNVERLVETFRHLDDERAHLVVAGKPGSEELGDRLEVLCDGDPRVHLDFRHIPDDELQVFMNSCDIVVLPYDDVLNSGSAFLALSFGRPVVLPSIGSLAELSEKVGKGWVHLYVGSLTPEVLTAARTAASEPRDDVESRISTWRDIGQMTCEAYQTVLRSRIRSAHA